MFNNFFLNEQRWIVHNCYFLYFLHNLMIFIVVMNYGFIVMGSIDLSLINIYILPFTRSKYTLIDFRLGSDKRIKLILKIIILTQTI